jgi:hypothetical protein
VEGSVTEYHIGNAIVRIHPGKLTEEERKVVLENAAKKFYKAVQQQRQKSANRESAQA